MLPCISHEAESLLPFIHSISKLSTQLLVLVDVCTSTVDAYLQLLTPNVATITTAVSCTIRAYALTVLSDCVL